MVSRRPPPPKPSPVLTIEQKRRGIARLRKRIEDLEAFDPQKVKKRFGVPEVTALETAIDEALSAIFGHGTVEYGRYTRAKQLDHGPVIMRGGWDDDGDYNYAHEARQYLAEGKQEALVLLHQAIRGLEEEIAEQEHDGHVAVPTPTPAPPSRGHTVFIVHGHDEGPRESVARFIEKLGLEAVILHERPNKGRAIITKFREEAAGVGFAVVLMTPDDLGKGKEEADLKPRARQNVIFELGFFIGALRPEHVAALVKGDIDLPSDYDGVVYIAMDNEDWRTKLAKELETAHYEIDWNKVMKP
jgi:predicted nucleotide-binding protein